MDMITLPFVEFPPIRPPEQRKALGQFFTGSALSSLLANLAKRDGIRSVIDPMCGSGDLLAAAGEVFTDATLVGIDVDSKVIEAASARFSCTDLVPLLLAANAFDPTLIQSIGAAFDLVLTNPPYVRYQSLSKPLPGLPKLATMAEIRMNLMQCVDVCSHLSEVEQEVFRTLISSYSGLSDLAVPSWILCAMMLRPGGTLALVVPETWLSRDYAEPIQYLLHKLFRLDFVVEDQARCWFPDAQVKTTLVVAERISPLNLYPQPEHSSDWVRAIVPRGAASQRSVVGRLFPGSTPDAEFTSEARRALFEDSSENSRAQIFSRHSKRPLVDSLINRVGNQPWFIALEPDHANLASASSNLLPLPLRSLLPELDSRQFTTLDALGYNIGQGLRTGANEFFYWTLRDQVDNICVLESGTALQTTIRVPPSVVRSVVRKQAEINGCLVVQPVKLSGRVLVLDGLWQPDNTNGVQGALPFETTPSTLPVDLARVIDRAASINVGSPDAPRFIPDLSAVRTNESPGRRRWYMLPPFAKRHLPDLFIARVNSKQPRAILNSSPPAVVDANFATLWREQPDAPSQNALLAFLHSSWALVCMEIGGTVMGGGALKLEATQLRRLPVPIASREQWDRLHLIGTRLRDLHLGTPEMRTCLDEVNDLITGELLNLPNAQIATRRIQELLDGQIRARGTK